MAPFPLYPSYEEGETTEHFFFILSSFFLKEKALGVSSLEYYHGDACPAEEELLKVSG